MTKPDKVLFTANVHTTGGREGASRRPPGYQAFVSRQRSQRHQSGAAVRRCLAGVLRGAMGLAARKMKVALPADTAIDAEVDLCLTDGAYFLQARLNVRMPGVERDVVQALVDAAHQTCPYSEATRGNIDVVINLL
jgi:osmotically inducible protein OsmC